MKLENIQIVIVGLGYVGLPLAIEFGKKYQTLGFDLNRTRIEQLKKAIDPKKEHTTEQILGAKYLSFTNELNREILPNRDTHQHIFIVTVPTPIDQFKKPDLSYLFSASKIIAKCLKKDDIVIYESTVYPGCTEEDCVPIIEKESGLKFNQDFFCGYSPERINPGDKQRTLTQIIKITSGSTNSIADFIDTLYASIIEAGTYKAPSIKVAEAAKLIENCQRDVNISFVNELALIFDRMNIDTADVLTAAATKWNFLNFKPGLVGGHCIGVDPYYMIYKAESLGYKPDLIGAGRRINEGMGIFIASKIIKLIAQKEIPLKGTKALILGITYKANCTDIRNTKVVDIYHELKEYGLEVDIHDPLADSKEVLIEYKIELLKEIKTIYQVIVIAVNHEEYKTLNLDNKLEKRHLVYEIN